MQTNELAFQDYNNSARYQAVDTLQVLEALGENWQVARVAGTNRKHQVIMRPTPEYRQKLPSFGDSEPTLVLRNSYDTSSSLLFAIGAWRIVCSNGLLLGSGFGIAARHVGNVRELVADVLKSVPEQIEAAKIPVDRAQQSPETPFTAPNFLWLVQKSLGQQNQCVNSDSLRNPHYSLAYNDFARRIAAGRRPEDKGTVWGAYNRVQEHCARGQIPWVKTHKDESTEIMFTRKRDMTSQLKIQRALWDGVVNPS